MIAAPGDHRSPLLGCLPRRSRRGDLRRRRGRGVGRAGLAARASTSSRVAMSQSLLLDEMFSDDIAQQLRTDGYDATSVVADLALVGLPDYQVLAYATTEGGTLVTANIKDFVPLDSRTALPARLTRAWSWYRPRPSRRIAAFPPRSQQPSPHCSAARPRSSPARCYSLRGARSDLGRRMPRRQDISALPACSAQS
jgi:hypothetical protein